MMRSRWSSLGGDLFSLKWAISEFTKLFPLFAIKSRGGAASASNRKTISLLSTLQKEQDPGFPKCCRNPHLRTPKNTQGIPALMNLDATAPFSESWS